MFPLYTGYSKWYDTRSMVYSLYMHILGQQSSFEEIAIYR